MFSSFYPDFYYAAFSCCFDVVFLELPFVATADNDNVNFEVYVYCSLS